MAVFNRQPQYVGPIDWSSSLAVGLADILIPSEFRTRINSDAASTINAADISSGFRSAGASRTIVNSSTSVRDIYSGAWSKVPFANGFTFLHVYRLTALPVGNVRVAGNFLGGAVSANGYAFSPTSANFRAIVGATTTSVVLTGSAVSTAPKVDFIEVNAATASLWENGVRTAGPTAATTAVAANGTFGLGSDNDGAALSAPSENFLSIVWKRSLTSAEIASISANPWQLFRKRNSPPPWQLILDQLMGQACC